jgi:Methyltransferase domain
MMRVVTTVLKKTDRKRWANTRNIYASWEPRSRMVAGLVPKGSRVIEFGAGRRVLEQYLDDSCTYRPSDIVDRGPGTIVCDLNQRPLPELGLNVYDVAVIVGVLEYVSDVPALLDWLTQYVTHIVLTYACTKANGRSPRALVETAVRMRHGWINNYREEDLRSLFRERGFELTRAEDWEKQRVFVFSRRGSSPTA